MMRYFRRLGAAIVLMALCGMGCQSASAPRPAGEVDYVGSSTIAIFMRDAEPAYGAIRFRIDTEPESEGGERAIVERRAGVAGIANAPRPATLEAGVASALIGRDAIAVIVNARNPVADLSTAALRRIFTGEIANWREIGGPDVPLTSFIVGEGSATRSVFKDVVLDGAEYFGCEMMQPDMDIIGAVASDPGGVGQISFSFLNGATGVRAVSIDGQRPSVFNFDYPVTRPLYLLWHKGDPVIDAFVAWSQSDKGQRVVMRHFVGSRVLGSARSEPAPSGMGTLIVRTETYAYYDGGIYYFPHRPYQVLTRKGALLRRVPNHRGENDEVPMRVDLEPGTYLIRADTSGAEPAEFLVTIDPGRTTQLDVAGLLQGRR